MPPSSPSEQARTRRENEYTKPTHSLRSAPRPARRVANRCAPKQESEASGHGHPSTAGILTLPNPKTSRGVRTISSGILKRGIVSTPKGKSGRTLFESDGNSTNIPKDSQHKQIANIDCPPASCTTAPIEGKIVTPQSVKEKIVQFSEFVGSGVISRSASLPNIASEKPVQVLDLEAESTKDGGLENGEYCEAIRSYTRPVQDNVTAMASFGSWNTRSELGIDLSQTQPLGILMADVNAFIPVENSKILGNMPFTTQRVIAQEAPLQIADSRSTPVATSPTISNRTSTKQGLNADTSLFITDSAMPESTKAFQANILPGFSSTQLANPSSSSVLAKRDAKRVSSPVSLTFPNGYGISQSKFTSMNLMQKRNSSIAAETKPLNASTNTLETGVSEISTVQKKTVKTSLKRRRSPMPEPTPQGHSLGVQSVTGEYMEIKDISGVAQFHRDKVNKV
jgi:hypothetical protein